MNDTKIPPIAPKRHSSTVKRLAFTYLARPIHHSATLYDLKTKSIEDPAWNRRNFVDNRALILQPACLQTKQLNSHWIADALRGSALGWMVGFGLMDPPAPTRAYLARMAARPVVQHVQAIDAAATA
ncbi:hypothetical protein [Xanthomonas theicola]|uniref:hypothetical protein n=1 Tax=Xanthomonas theicola TaxID=56464 RepID=UPI00361B0F9F